MLSALCKAGTYTCKQLFIFVYVIQKLFMGKNGLWEHTVANDSNDKHRLIQ